MEQGNTQAQAHRHRQASALRREHTPSQPLSTPSTDSSHPVFKQTLERMTIVSPIKSPTETRTCPGPDFCSAVSVSLATLE
jgi:hypothetical protein